MEECLVTLKFDGYAKYKTKTNPEFGEYPAFERVLKAIKELECVTCKDKADDASCKIRQCVLSKEMNGCWECNGSEGCELLVPMKKIHSCIEHNHQVIKDHGYERWSNQRANHYDWDESAPRKR